MNEPYKLQKGYVVWIERGEALGNRLNRLVESGLIGRIWRAPSAGIHRLIHWLDVVTRHRPSHH